MLLVDCRVEDVEVVGLERKLGQLLHGTGYSFSSSHCTSEPIEIPTKSLLSVRSMKCVDHVCEERYVVLNTWHVERRRGAVVGGADVVVARDHAQAELLAQLQSLVRVALLNPSVWAKRMWRSKNSPSKINSTLTNLGA